MTSNKIPTRKSNPLLQNVLRLCSRMSSAAIEFRLIVRLPVLVEEFGEAYRALRHIDQVRILLDIDDELIDHAYMELHRIVPAAVDEAAKAFVAGLDKDGWKQVLLVALEVPDYPSENVVSLEAYRTG
jgi:hypothetical protein